MAMINCRHFSGYKPCGESPHCESACPAYSPVDKRILIVHLEAMGAVLRSTSLLQAIKRKYPRSHVTWVTKAPAQALLENLPHVDRTLTLNQEDLLKLSALSFDLALVIDKSLVASGVLRHTTVNEVRGFWTAHSHGAIVPANQEATELWELGLSDQKKFYVNQKSEQRLVHEALALGDYAQDEYQIGLSEREQGLLRLRREAWSRPGKATIGINTGCSGSLPHKKLSVSGHRRLIEKMLLHPQLRQSPIVLLGGGKEDGERNEEIAHGLPVILSSTENGLRDGLVSVAACDLVFTGDSLGMHMAIGLQKWVVAWFGPTCAQEIDLYGRGHKLRTRAPCAPCWKRVCQQTDMCYDQVDFGQAVAHLAEGVKWLISSSKPPSPEISFSPSPF